MNSADLVITGAPVYTSVRQGPPADTVAVRGGLITAVGTFSDVGGLIGPATRVFRLSGGMIVPGASYFAVSS